MAWASVSGFTERSVTLSLLAEMVRKRQSWKTRMHILEDVHPCISVWYIYMRAFLYFLRTGYGRISWYFWYATLWPVTRLSCAWFLARVCSIGFCIREAYAVPLRRLCAALWTNNKVSTAIIAALQSLLIRKVGDVYSWWIHEWLIRFPSRKSHISNRCSSILGKF